MHHQLKAGAARLCLQRGPRAGRVKSRQRHCVGVAWSGSAPSSVLLAAALFLRGNGSDFTCCQPSKQVQGEDRVGHLVSHLSNACTVWHAQHQRCESAKTHGLGLVCRVGYEARPGFQQRAMSHEGTVVILGHALGQPAVACQVCSQLACTCCRPPVTAARVTISWQVRVAPAAGRKGPSSALGLLC